MKLGCQATLTDEQLGAQLCYVLKPWAYFTTQDLDKQTGDDWNDAPYECNAGTPYYPREGDIYQVVVVCFDRELEVPSEFCRRHISVDEINRRVVPWLHTEDWERKQQAIYAGTTLREFIPMIEGLGGQVYIPLPRGQAEADQ